MDMKVSQVISTLQKSYDETDNEELKLELKYMIEDLMMYKHEII